MKFNIQTISWRKKETTGNRKTGGGFTIIETLVAVAILMIAISGPLVVANKGLTSALYARDQVTASYLAQETMEVIKNNRDNNMNSDPSTWLNNIVDNANCISSVAVCEISPLVLYGSGAPNPCTVGDCDVYYADGVGFSNDSAVITKTIFDRYYYLTLPYSPPSVPSPCTSTASECEIHVEVTWNEGTVPYDVSLVSELVNNPTR